MENVGFIVKESPEAKRSAKRVAVTLRKYGAKPLFDPKKFAAAELLIAVGGDGTLLNAARIAGPHGLPLLGINLGRLGFLSEVDLEAALRALPKILKGQYVEDRRMMIEARVVRKKKTIAQTLALNDFVLGKTGIARLIHVECFTRNSLIATYEADGLIISTPTGSTAHSLSAGGPLLYPHLEVVSLTAIAPHTVGSRPIVLGPDATNEPLELRIVLSETPAGLQCLLTTDGQNTVPLKKGDEIWITESPHQTIFVRLKPYDFMRVVRQKLGWGRG